MWTGTESAVGSLLCAREMKRRKTEAESGRSSETEPVQRARNSAGGGWGKGVIDSPAACSALNE
jgi:hypothetical protein